MTRTYRPRNGGCFSESTPWRIALMELYYQLVDEKSRMLTVS